MRARVFDYIYYQGKRHVIEGRRGNDVLFDPKELHLPMNEETIPRWQGYIATYGVARDQRLVLKDLRARFVDPFGFPIQRQELTPFLNNCWPRLNVGGLWVYENVNIPIFYSGELLVRRCKPRKPDDEDSQEEPEGELISLAFYFGRLGFDREYVEKILERRPFGKGRYSMKSCDYDYSDPIPF